MFAPIQGAMAREGFFIQYKIASFRQHLLRWFALNQRDLPWRHTRDPYAIWISEIMLQQTRVAAVIPYYERFLARFPDIQTLAEAPEPDLLARWAGLGYYHRARNLQRAARIMISAGGFPATYDELRKLPGIGDYTAAAIASIGLGLPHAVLDGNVLRVLSRVFDDATSIDSVNGRARFARLAAEILDREQPGAFNQAMMELGATICLPKNPQCLICPVSASCQARQNGSQSDRPVKSGPQKQVREKRVAYWIERDGKLLLWQRSSGSRLMPGFWELPEPGQLPGVVAGRKLGSFRHGITFHNYRFEVLEAAPPDDCGPCQWIARDTLDRMPASTVLRKAMSLLL